MLYAGGPTVGVAVLVFQQAKYAAADFLMLLPAASARSHRPRADAPRGAAFQGAEARGPAPTRPLQ